ATRALELTGCHVDAPEVPVAVHAPIAPDQTFREISYEEHGGVGYLNFEFYNGAMSTDQSRRLRDAYVYARSRSQTKVIVLGGGADFFSNGIHLNVIEAAEDPASSRGSTCTRSTTSCARSSRPAPTWWSRRSRGTPPPVACRWRSRLTTWWRA